MYSWPPPKAPEATLLTPQVGQSPPTAMFCCQTGPDARSPWLKAYATPFLLTAVTMLSPPALNSVVDVPKSESRTVSYSGSFQLSTTSIVDGSMARNACAHCC